MSSKKLRILVISLGRRGGIPVYGFEMSKSLAAISDIAVIYSSYAENVEDWHHVNVQQLKINTYLNMKEALLSYFNILNFKKIRNFVDKFKPDVIYYPGGHLWKPVLDFILLKNIPVILTVHDPVLHKGENSILARIINKLNIINSEGYVILNNAQKESFIEKNKLKSDQVLTLPHGIFSGYVDEVKQIGKFDEFSEIEGITGNYFLFAGRIQKYKGIETLLKAYIKILEKCTMPLVIAGSGNFSEQEKLLMDKIPTKKIIVFNKWLSESELATLVANSYMSVLPYEGATQSGIIPLSYALKIPVISSDSGGLVEQVVHGNTGYIFPTSNEDALADALLNATGIYRADYLKMKNSCYEYAVNNWSWDSLSVRLAVFLNGIIITESKQTAKE